MNPMGVAMTPEQYAQEWATSATNFEASADYAWMAGCLPARNLTVEIGCGNGMSTLALAASSPAVISVDINDHMIAAASARVTAAGIPTSAVDVRDFPLKAGTGRNVQFLLANIMDPALDAAVEPGSVDAIAVWFIGASPGVIAEILETDIPSLSREDMLTCPGFSSHSFL